MRNLHVYVQKIVCSTALGTTIDAASKDVKEMAKLFKTKVEYTHNDQKYICDEEGNMARLN